MMMRKLQQLKSHAEVILSYALAVLMHIAVFPAQGLNVNLVQNLRIGAALTLASITRGLGLQWVAGRMPIFGSNRS
jgi:hypothetical protein